LKAFKERIGKAKVEREGADVSIIAFSRPVSFALEAAAELEKEGISAEVLNLRTLRPMDRQAIIDTVKKTNRVVTVEEGWPQCGLGSEIAAVIMETEAFDHLDAPVERVAMADIPMAYALNLERATVPQVDDILAAARRACYRQL